MKRTRHGLRLATCLLVLAACGPLFAGPALGGSDDRRGHQRGDDRRGSYHSDDRRGEYGSRDRDSSRSRSGERTRAQERPLGTLHDDHRGRSDDHRWERRDDRHGHPDQRHRYGSDARRAADAVRRDERGRVLSSEPTGDRGYRVRVLTPDGYVRERYVEPRDDRHR